MLGWAAVAIAGDLSLEDARALGVPDGHVALDACDCLRLSWLESGGEAVFSVHRPLLVGLRHDRTPQGVHEIHLLLADDTSLWIEAAPCAAAAPMVADYAARFGVPVTGTASEVACADVETPMAQFQKRRLVTVGPVDYGQVATVNATSRDGDTALDVVAAYSAERAILGRCFRVDGVETPGRVTVAGRVERDGRVTAAKVSRAGPDGAIDACVLARLANHRVAARAHPLRVSIAVSWAEGAAPAAVSP